MLWATIVVAFNIIAIPIMMQERGPGGSFEGMPFIKAVITSNFQAAGAFFGVAGYEPTNIGSKWTTLALGILIFFIGTTYTASLATMLVLESTATNEIRSLDVALQKGKLCVGGSIYAILQTTHGVSDDSMLVFDSRSDVWPAYEAGECVAAVVKREDLEMLHAAGEYCDMMPVGETFFSVGFGSPVSRKVHRTLSWMYTELEGSGEWSKSLQRFAPESTCVPEEAQGGTTMQTVSMLGPFVVSAGLLAIGLCVTFATNMRHNQTGQTNERDQPSQSETPGETSNKPDQPSQSEMLAEISELRKELPAMLRKELAAVLDDLPVAISERSESQLTGRQGVRDA